MAVSIFPPRCQRQRAWQKRSKQKINSKPNCSPNLTPTLKITLTSTLTLTQTLTLNLTPKHKLWKVLKKVKKREFAKVRVELKSNGIADVKHNCYAMCSTLIA